MSGMVIALGADHGGSELKNSLKAYLEKRDIQVQDFGVDDGTSVDYPDRALPVIRSIISGQAHVGILCCGTGIGLSIKANRYKGIRSALIYNAFTAEKAKAHNNANVVCLGGRTLSKDEAKILVQVWLDTAFEGGRHQRRLDKLEVD